MRDDDLDSARPDPLEDKSLLQPQPKSGALPHVPTDGCPGHALLYSELSETELLTRLSDGDPLQLYERVVRRARDEALLIDGDRLFSETLRHIVAVNRPNRREDLDTWFAERIGTSIRTLLNEDCRSLSNGTPVSFETPHAFIEQAFGVDSSTTLSASVAFNKLPMRARRAFLALLVEERSVAECIESNLGTRDTLGGLARQGLRALTGRQPGTGHHMSTDGASADTLGGEA